MESCDDDVEVEVASPALIEGTVNVNKFHELMGHPSEAKTRLVAAYYGVKLSGQFKTCSACAKAKAKQANVPKKLKEGKRSTVPGERLSFDIASIKAQSYGGAKYWLLIMDDATGHIWSLFVKKKSEIAGLIVRLIKHLKKSMNYKTKFLRCDNAGENLMRGSLS